VGSGECDIVIAAVDCKIGRGAGVGDGVGAGVGDGVGAGVGDGVGTGVAAGTVG